MQLIDDHLRHTIDHLNTCVDPEFRQDLLEQWITDHSDFVPPPLRQTVFNYLVYLASLQVSCDQCLTNEMIANEIFRSVQKRNAQKGQKRKR